MSVTMSDDEDELPDDEEEILVYVEFDGSVVSNTFMNENLNLDMIGLDMEHPIMEVNGKFYEGTYHDAVGTYMFFERDENPQIDDPVFDAIPSLKYRAKTRKVLRMHRIFVEQKTEMLGDSQDPDCLPNMNTIEKIGVPPAYQEEALGSWRKMREDRIQALNDYLEKQRLREEKRSRGIEPDSESDDDNPFAMYKPDAKQRRNKREGNASKSASEENVTLDRDMEDSVTEASGKTIEKNTATIMDPGPSTSKDSKPWKSPVQESPADGFISTDSEEDIYRINLPNVIGKHSASVQLTRKSKIRKYFRDNSSRKEPSIESQEKENFYLDESMQTCSSQIVDETLNDDETNKKITNTEEPTIDILGSLFINESTEDLTKNSPEKLEDKLKLEKQQKRDEKMRLIAEKFKKAAEEARLKKHHKLNDV